MKLRDSLFWKTFALTALVVVLVSSLLLYLLHQRQHLVAQREAASHAAFLASQCVKPVLWDDRLQLKALLDATVEKKAAAYAWLERNGAVPAHTFPQGMPRGLLDLHPGKNPGPTVRAWQDPERRGFLDVAVPLPQSANATLHVGIAESALDEGLANLLPATAAIALLALALGAALAWAMANAVTREARAATQALADSELKYRTLADNTTDWEFWIGPDGKAIYNSPSCERLIDHTPEELAADPEIFARLIHPDDAPRFAAHRHAALANHREEALELRIIDGNGALRWISHRCHPVFGANEEFLGTRGSNIDITERKQYEQAVERDAQEWIQAMDAFAEVIYLIDTERRILRANRMFYTLTGNDPADTVGKCVAEVIHRPGEEALCPVCQAQREKRDAVIVLEADHPANSTRRPIEVTVKVIRTASGEPRTMLTSIRDLSGTRKIENELRQLNISLEQRVREEVARNREKDHLLIQQSRLAAMGEMIGNIAHQWRQPINALGLVLANIKDAYEYDELDEEYLGKAVRSGQHLIQAMSSTIDDFRNFFRPNKEKQVFQLCDAVHEALKLIDHSFRNNNIELTFESCAADCSVVGYPNEFSQVVLNALSNAKDAIVEQNIRGNLLIRFESSPGMHAVTIRDNGGGIRAEILGKVFDPYFTTKAKGTGVGLYMSKMIMENMGGDIAIRNLGAGAEVRLALPLAERGADAYNPACSDNGQAPR